MLDKVKVVHSPLTDKLYIARFGKDPRAALETREAEAEIMAALVEHMMFETPNGSKKEFSFGDQRYRVTLVPIEPETVTKGF